MSIASGTPVDKIPLQASLSSGMFISHLPDCQWLEVAEPRGHCGLVLEVGRKTSFHHSYSCDCAAVRSDASAEGCFPFVVDQALSCCPLRNAVSIDVPRSCIVCCSTYFGPAAVEAQRGAVGTVASHRGSCHTCAGLVEILGVPSWEQLAFPGSDIH